MKHSFLNWKILLAAVTLMITFMVIGMTAGVNDAGNRTVIQYPTGQMAVKFTPGWYLKWFGTTTEYRDVLTYDFDREQSGGEGISLDYPGIKVRYRDGGEGTIYGVVQFMLPGDEENMLNLHRSYRSNNNVAHKLVKQVTEEAVNLTAGLMTSEEGYDTKRAVFTEWVTEQIKNGKYKTVANSIIEKDEVTGKSVEKTIAVIAIGQDGQAQHIPSDLKNFGISIVGGVRLNNPDFEPKTLEQIAKKREATMAIITAKANAERAKQDSITAEEQGKANVMTARYEKEVEKEKAVVTAEQEKEVAIIKAAQKVDVAEQAKKEAEQNKLAANEIKQEQILLGEGESERKRLVMQADGQLQLKLEAWKEATIAGYKYLGQQKWVPEISMGGDGSNTSGQNVVDFMDILKTKAAKDLALDMKMGVNQK